jgi:hypothetical protein
MDALIVWAACIALAIVVRFFGVLSTGRVATAYLRFVRGITLPLDAPSVATPYGGIFDAAAALTVVVLLLVEWLLSLLRDRVG